MRRVELNTIPKTDSNETPYWIPEGASAVSAKEFDVKYICGECETTLAELPYMVTLSMVLSKSDGMEAIDAEIHVVQCPECSSFNEFPFADNNPMEDSSPPPDFEENLERLLRQSERKIGDKSSQLQHSCR